jgi:hypothetical protein
MRGGQAPGDIRAGGGERDPEWCTPEQPMPLMGEADAAATHRVLSIRLSFSEDACVIAGYLDVAFADQNGHELTVDLNQGSSFGLHPRMTPMRARLLSRRVAVSIGGTLVVLGASGCIASTDPSDAAAASSEAVETATPVPSTPTAAATSTTDEETCKAFGDVLTIMHNTEAAVRDGRMGEQERLGWYRLATRVQDNVPSADEGPVAEALAALKQAAPAIPPVELGTPGIGSDAWNVADLGEACAAAGSELVTEGFVGG